MLETIESLSTQVDRIFLVLNEYDDVPGELREFNNVEAIIPEYDTKDVGKFLCHPSENDIVFTVDDDILYPPDYVRKTLQSAERTGLDKGIFGYQANVWAYKKNISEFGWKTFMFFKPLKKTTKVDVIGTGTACMLGKNMPDVSLLKGCEGFVDIRFSNIQKDRDLTCWSLPRPSEFLKRNLPENLKFSSLFHTGVKLRRDDILRETNILISKIQNG